MKDVLLIHGFNGIPKIFNYFKKELENKGLAIREDIAEVLIDTKKLAENGK